MKDFSQLDEAILARIAKSPCRYAVILAAVIEIAEPLASNAGSFRLVDRRLQALHKRGAIQFRKGEWYLADKPSDIERSSDGKA